ESVVKGAGNVWSIAASVTGPIFQAGKLYGGYKSAVANWEAARWQYEGVVLNALREVSNALVDAQKLIDVREQRAKAVSALQEASELATIRYTGGLATYFEVLEAQQQLFPAEDQLAQTERDELLAVVQLYAALGGGWSDGEQQVPLDAFPSWPYQPPQDCVLGRVRRRVWSARGTHLLHVAAGKAGATILVRTEQVPTCVRESRPASVPRLPRQLGWPRHGGRPCHRAAPARRTPRPPTEAWG